MLNTRSLKPIRRCGWSLASALGAAIIVAAAAAQARATEPRPWLCRDKPVFSSSQPMTWTATNRGGERWVMLFMRFDPDGGHDGFTVYDTRTISGSDSGSLQPGQWYAVGMYREGSHWICSARASENPHFVPGVVRDLCYSETPGGCALKMVVKDAGGAHN